MTTESTHAVEALSEVNTYNTIKCFQNQCPGGIFIMKRCARCKELKSLNEFSRHKSRKDGRQVYCKDCVRKWNEKNRDKLRKAQRKWSKKNRDKKNAYHNRRNRTHPEKVAAVARITYLISRGCIPPASDHECIVCGETAQDYHHPSYAPEHKECVHPVCKKCHMQYHFGTLPKMFRLLLEVIPHPVLEAY